MPNHEEIPTTDTAQIEQIIERLNQLRILLLELALFESLDELLDLRGVGGWNFFVIWHVRSNALILCQVRAVAKPRPHFFFFTTLYRNDTNEQVERGANNGDHDRAQQRRPEPADLEIDAEGFCRCGCQSEHRGIDDQNEQPQRQQDQRAGAKHQDRWRQSIE